MAPKKCHPAAQLRAEGVDIAIISRQLGHSSISTTARYLDHLAPRAVIETIRQRNWIGAWLADGWLIGNLVPFPTDGTMSFV